MTEKELRTIVAHPFLALAREFQWDDRQLEAANKLIDITTIRLFEGGLAVPPAPSGAPHPEIEAFWQGVQRGWDIEPREYFEREAPKNGFRFPIAQALHHIWKRCVTENPPFGVAAPAPSAPPPETEK